MVMARFRVRVRRVRAMVRARVRVTDNDEFLHCFSVSHERHTTQSWKQKVEFDPQMRKAILGRIESVYLVL